MKVLFTTNIPAPYRMDFFNELGNMCDLTVAFEDNKVSDRNIQWMNRKAENFKLIMLKGIKIGKDNSINFSVLKLLKDKWDVIIIGDYSTPTSIIEIEYLKMKKIPFYIEADGGLIHSDSKIKYWLKKHLISAAENWFSSGVETTMYLTHYGAKEDKCYTYPFTTLLKKDIEYASGYRREDKNRMKHKLNMTEKVIVLSVGRFSYEKGYGKGYDVIMRAAEKMNDDIGFYIVGDEPTEEFIRWKKEKNLEHVHFVGYKDKSKLADYYIAADIFVLMTISDVWGLVINEAMMYSLPVISTNKCVAAVELVENDVNGYVLNVGDDEGLKNCIYKIKNNNLFENMGAQSFSKIQYYTIENMAQVHIDVMERNLKGKRNENRI